MWSAPLWAVFMALMLGAGAGIITHVGLRYFDRPRVPRDVQHAREELDVHVRRVIGCNVELMQAVRDLVELLKRLPPEYRPAAEHALRFAQLLEEGVFEEGAREGVFPRHQFGYPGERPPAPEEAEPLPVEAVSTPSLRLVEGALSGDMLASYLEEQRR